MSHARRPIDGNVSASRRLAWTRAPVTDRRRCVRHRTLRPEIDLFAADVSPTVLEPVPDLRAAARHPGATPE